MTSTANADEGSSKYKPRTKFYKPKRVSDGLPDPVMKLNLSIKDKGLLCKGCKKYLMWRQLQTGYESRQGKLYMLWICPNDGNVLKEQQLGD